jgi:uncharacterized protein (DUF2235 family)
MGKRIIVCIDGTNNDPIGGRTNVSRFMRMVAKVPGEQVAYYQPGVGTLDPDRPGSKRVAAARRFYDSMTAWMISSHVQSPYRYLMSEYEDGDRVYLVGFSRGAYVCRVLAGMLNKVGLLHRGQDEMVSFAWKLYVPARNDEQSGRFKKFYARDLSIEFLGLWDTVRSVGTPWRPTVFPHTLNNAKVSVVRHAIALDERRVLFPSNLWAGTPHHAQDVLQVWFPGVHADIGGGYTGDDHPGLGAISLAWMVREAEATGIAVDDHEQRRLGWRKHLAAPPGKLSVQAVTTEFINEPMHDEVAAHRHWQLAEALPIPRWVATTDGEWERSWRPHKRQARFVPPYTKIHESVRLRMERDASYRPENLPDAIPADRFVW